MRMMRYLPRGLVPILLYHHVGSIGRRSRSYLSPAMLEGQFRRMRRGGVVAGDLGALVERLRARRPVPRKTVAVTFDDGWRDNHASGLPLLARYGIPATVFLVSGRIGLKEYLGWSEIEEMRKEGVRFGAHSITHPRLTEIPPEDARREIADSRKSIEDGLGEAVTIFCYPYGFFNRAVRDMVEEAGYRGACCNAPGRLWPDGDPFALKRVTMTYRMNRRVVLTAALSGYYVYFKELRAGNKDYILLNPKSQIPNPKSI